MNIIFNMILVLAFYRQEHWVANRRTFGGLLLEIRLVQVHLLVVDLPVKFICLIWPNLHSVSAILWNPILIDFYQIRSHWLQHLALVTLILNGRIWILIVIRMQLQFVQNQLDLNLFGYSNHHQIRHGKLMLSTKKLEQINLKLCGLMMVTINDFWSFVLDQDKDNLSFSGWTIQIMIGQELQKLWKPSLERNLFKNIRNMLVLDGFSNRYWLNVTLSQSKFWTSEKEGAYINIEIVDVNNDGRLDILTSVSGFRGQPGKVICYEVPDNAAFYKGTWKKHILSSSFPPTENYRRISPGGVYAFYPGWF